LWVSCKPKQHKSKPHMYLQTICLWSMHACSDVVT
jgi:hypothetical protein